MVMLCYGRSGWEPAPAICEGVEGTLSGHTVPAHTVVPGSHIWWAIPERWTVGGNLNGRGADKTIKWLGQGGVPHSGCRVAGHRNGLASLIHSRRDPVNRGYPGKRYHRVGLGRDESRFFAFLAPRPWVVVFRMRYLAQAGEGSQLTSQRRGP